MGKLERIMAIAYKEAKKAYKKGEVPVGAVIVDENETVIAKAYNRRMKNNDILGHAEIEAIRKAGKKKKNWRLDGCKIFVTMEPCLMCTGAIIQSRIKSIYFGVEATNREPTLMSLEDYLFDNGFEVEGRIYYKKIKVLVDQFLEEIREYNKQKKEEEE